ncbi:type II secretion system inner membrane protein GspF [Thorsellia anophelis]|uniref:General secretion pathway protein F n=1 Tax=Thorsellia anophelis DSM 18579 TaxID=1123402 RepID=A0A1I0AX75_9GAMM|nr:type II secretion system inner membrane protein GspF [Thorsellia anophelis]SES98392.1 general secretion pathway protein F [Thorsellia anophelis DSM 18579]
MANFRYVARLSNGKDQKGQIEADTEKQARVKLKEQGLFVITVSQVDSLSLPQSKTMTPVEPKHAHAKGFNFKLTLFGPKKVKSKAIALFTRQLATMVSSALPLEESLKAVGEQSESAYVVSIIYSVREKVLEGHTLSNAMKAHPYMFDSMYCAMVEAAEASGHLAPILMRLADYTEQKQKMQMQLTQALVYPTMLTLVACTVIMMLLTFVVPKVVEQFVYMKQTLPLSTRILIGISDFLSVFGLYLLLGLLLSLLGIKKSLSVDSRRAKYDRFILTLPIVGQLIRDANSARYARTLSILQASGVPLIEAMHISANVITNQEIKAKFQSAANFVREGGTIYQAFSQTKLLSPMMLYMIASGEKSGELDTLLAKAAQTQDDALSAKITFALSVFEPMLILTMAGVVLFIVLAIMQPIIALNTMFG